jgi:hypothetical protein
MRYRSSNELAEALVNQMRALQASCESYDRGNKWEALRLATAVYVIVHDGGKRNRGLLTHIGVKTTMKFLASGKEVDPDNLIADTPLVGLQLGGTENAAYVPLLNQHPNLHRWVSFGEWWERDSIFRSGDNKHSLSRKKLVFALRNQDGGSHFDEVVMDPNYAEMTHGKGWISVSPDGLQRPVRQLEMATMRQVAWELQQSLKKAGVYG